MWGDFVKEKQNRPPIEGGLFFDEALAKAING
jgi:hypothetical protein